MLLTYNSQINIFSYDQNDFSMTHSIPKLWENSSFNSKIKLIQNYLVMLLNRTQNSIDNFYIWNLETKQLYSTLKISETFDYYIADFDLGMNNGTP